MSEHHASLVAAIAAGLLLAWALGLAAHRLRIQPIVGYLLAGIAIGPFTPGFSIDAAFAADLAQIGVVLLMFGIGLHFSLRDVARLSLVGAVGQIAVATLMGAALAHALGWPVEAGLMFGLSLSVASTAVLVRTLQARGLYGSDRGRIAAGWVVVEELAIVLALALVPDAALASAGDGVSAVDMALVLLGSALEVSLFVAIMLVVGRRVVPWLIQRTAATGSRELSRLSVHAVALAVAFGAAGLLDVSLSLGAFFAGVVLGRTALGQHETEQVMPLRDAFAVLFFVSVGMLLDPLVFVTAPLAVFWTALIVVVGKSIAAYLIVRVFGYARGTALTVSAGLAQIGELSFVLVGVGMALQLLPRDAQDLVLAGVVVSIVLNPLLFLLIERASAAEQPGGTGSTFRGRGM
jgi:CPA2 family monovalent cation:H+ antiporter-2